MGCSTTRKVLESKIDNILYILTKEGEDNCKELSKLR